MRHGEGTLRGKPQTLYYQFWMPDSEGKASLLIIHGLAEHSGRYRHVARFMVDRGHSVYALDHPGHGRSDGPRCHIERFSDYTDAGGLLLETVRRDRPRSPVFLIGHSLGGLIAMRLLLERQSEFAGCVLSGAALKAASPPSSLLRRALALLSTVAPRLRVMQLDASAISRDGEVVDRYRKDPLVYRGRVTARLADQVFTTMTELPQGLASIVLPMLILHGSADKLTDPAGSEMLHSRIASTDKQLIVYDGLYHEIYNEPEQQVVMADVAAWLEARTQPT